MGERGTYVGGAEHPFALRAVLYRHAGMHPLRRIAVHSSHYRRLDTEVLKNVDQKVFVKALMESKSRCGVRPGLQVKCSKVVKFKSSQL